MSAALQLPVVWGTGSSQFVWPRPPVIEHEMPAAPNQPKPPHKPREAQPEISLAFYRKHTENMLRRYLYASMQVGRAPSILGDPVGRGWASPRPLRPFA